MRLHAAPAECTRRLVAISGAGHIDFARHAPPHPVLSRCGGDTRNLHDFADKLVSRGAAKPVITAQDLDVGIADSREAHADQAPTTCQPWERFSSGNQLMITDREAKHGSALLLWLLGQGTARGGGGHTLEQFKFCF